MRKGKPSSALISWLKDEIGDHGREASPHGCHTETFISHLAAGCWMTSQPRGVCFYPTKLTAFSFRFDRVCNLFAWHSRGHLGSATCSVLTFDLCDCCLIRLYWLYYAWMLHEEKHSLSLSQTHTQRHTHIHTLTHTMFLYLALCHQSLSLFLYGPFPYKIVPGFLKINAFHSSW